MASELITDDFNRGDQELNGSVSAEGWAWEKMFTSASFLRIDADAGKDDTPGVQNGSGIFFRLYRAAEQIASPFVGAQVDVSRSIAGGGVALAIKVQDQNNFYFMDFLHSTGLLRVFEKPYVPGAVDHQAAAVMHASQRHHRKFLEDSGVENLRPLPDDD